jgi:predicted small secreted protein
MKTLTVSLLIAALLLTGCASYTTPGGGVRMSDLADAEINELMSKEPAAIFPVISR